MQDHMSIINREMETLRKNQKEMLEIKSVTKMKNGFDGLISRLDIVKLAASLKVCPFHVPKWNAKE